MGSERKLHFMSWNSNGLKKNKEEKKSEIKKYDVVFLQETHSGESEVLEMLEDYKSFYTTQTLTNTGVAILIKKNILEESDFTREKDPTGCYILVKCTLKGQLFTLVSVYNCKTYIKPLLKLRSVLEKHAEGILLIGGDFNVSLNPYLDRTSTTLNTAHLYVRPIVKELMSSFHLVDVWRRLHPIDRQYTYQQNNVWSRLDYIFVPEESMQYIEMCNIPLHKISDHYQVEIEINIAQIESKTPDFCVDKEEGKGHILNFQKLVLNKWLTCKRKYWPNIDLTINPHTSLMISAGEVEQAIQSLVENDIKRPDGIPLSFYKSYSHLLIPYLCAYYHNMLEQPAKIPDAFNKMIPISKTHVFNIDYLILATIMARWLYEHLQSHSTDYVKGDNNKKNLNKIKALLIAFKKQPRKVEVMWSVLNDILNKEKDERKTNPPLLDKFNINVLHRILIHSPKVKYKLLYWGCPLTPVLITLFFKHYFYDEMVENVILHSIHISKENVIFRLPVDSVTDSFESLAEKFNVQLISL